MTEIFAWGLLSARSKGSLALFEALAERDKLSGPHLATAVRVLDRLNRSLPDLVAHE
jgi:hypothetical protein